MTPEVSQAEGKCIMLILGYTQYHRLISKGGGIGRVSFYINSHEGMCLKKIQP